jgi:hypothetical protein
VTRRSWSSLREMQANRSHRHTTRYAPRTAHPRSGKRAPAVISPTLPRCRLHCGWGHSLLKQMLHFGTLAKVKRLVPFHLDPNGFGR